MSLKYFEAKRRTDAIEEISSLCESLAEKLGVDISGPDDSERYTPDDALYLVQLEGIVETLQNIDAAI